MHIVDLSIESAQDTVDEIQKDEGKVFSYVCTLANQKEVLATFEKTGNIHILINNAGIPHVGKVDTTSEVDFDRIIEINVKGVYNCLHAAIPQFKKSGGGVIINMASIATLVLFLCSDEAGFITGCDYPIDGGFIKLNN